jgi:hypothetical protein
MGGLTLDALEREGKETQMSHDIFRTAAMLILAFAVTACGAGAPPASPTAAVTATSLPTDTPVPTPTVTPLPTETPLPTSTPNVAATQQAEAVQALLASFREQGLIDNTEGSIQTLPDFTHASTNKFDLEHVTDTGETLGDRFLFSAHFKWESAISTPDRNGCGMVFGMQPNGDRYAIFVDKEVILFALKRNTYFYRVGRTGGPAGPKLGTPTELDFALLANGQMAYVSLNGAVTTYTLSADQPAAGKLGLTMLAGAARDYGTRCRMTRITVWRPAED